jgi:hypothetical protein
MQESFTDDAATTEEKLAAMSQAGAGEVVDHFEWGDVIRGTMWKPAETDMYVIWQHDETGEPVEMVVMLPRQPDNWEHYIDF